MKLILKKIAISLLPALLTLALFFGAALALAQEGEAPEGNGQTIEENGAEEDIGQDENGQPEELEDPSPIQAVRLTAIPEEEAEEWKRDALQTFALKFMIRGKEALAWSLNIEDAGFHNDAIQSSYLKVLTIVNSLFILGLLAIAAMWMFSIIIPRRYLRQVVLVYGMAVVFVNFAMPLNQLFIDSTNLLQKTFLTQEGNPIGIVDIVETPVYNAEDTIGWRNESGILQDKAEKNIGLTITQGDAEEVLVGEIGQALPMTLTGGLAGDSIILTVPASRQSLTLKTGQPLTAQLKSEKPLDPNREQALFTAGMLLLTGAAYLLIALIFVMRIVILWALLILSPVLFLLAVFKATRGYFYNWLSIYGRWLLIGPLVALGISILVNIWQTVGLPITSSYTAGTTLSPISNVAFMLPGKTALNHLSTTGEMMEYLVFLLMLYLPIFFAFALTRQKMFQSAAATVAERWRPAGRGAAAGRKTIEETETAETRHSVSKSEGKLGLIGGLKDLFSHQIDKITTTALPSAMRAVSRGPGEPIPSASAFLPEHLALTGIHDMLSLLGAKKESRHSREDVIEKLAVPQKISDRAHKENVIAVRKEIEKRAEKGDSGSILLMEEIHNKETQITEPAPAPVTAKTQPTDVGAGHARTEEARSVQPEEKTEKETVETRFIASEKEEKETPATEVTIAPEVSVTPEPAEGTERNRSADREVIKEKETIIKKETVETRSDEALAKADASKEKKEKGKTEEGEDKHPRKNKKEEKETPEPDEETDKSNLS